MKNTSPPQLLAVVWLALLGAVPALAQPTVLVRNPYRNALSALRPTNVALTFSQTMGAATDQNVRVFSAQRGGRKAGAYATVGNTITFNPTTDFRPGEVVSVTVPTTVKSAANVSAVKHVYQFTAAATGGSGYFSTPAFGAELNPGIDPSYTTVGDLDNDGDLDMVVTSDASATVQVLLNNGFGLFIAGSTVAAGTGRRAMLGDLDGDGDLDLITGDDFTNVVHVRFNNGSGTFGGGANLALTATDIALGDLDADGDLDFVTINQANRTVSVEINNGAGTFSAGIAVVLGGNASIGALFGVELADIDSDGDLDLLASDYEQGRVYTRLNNGSAAFSGGATISFSGQVVALVVGDLDSDGDLDFIAGGAPALFGSGLAQSQVCFNNGAGTFAVAAANPALSLFSGFDCRLGDVDGDGDLDLISPAGAEHPYVNIRLNDGAGTFAAAPTAPDVALPDDALFVSVADFDNDGDLDLATPNGTVSVRLNQSPFVVSSTNPARNAVAAAPATSLGITFSKAVDNATAAGLRVYGAQAGGKKAGLRSAVGQVLTFNPTTNFQPGERVDVTVPATVEATGGQVLQRPYVYQLTAATAGGSGYFAPQASLAASFGPQGVRSADVNGDGRPDILIIDATHNRIVVRLNNGDGTFAAATNVSTGEDPRDLVVADVDADGDLDILAANLQDGTVSVRFNNGSGTFSGVTDAAIGMQNANYLTTGDVDGDGDLDLLVTGGSQNLTILRNNGAGVFSQAPALSIGFFPSRWALADVDGDGDLDALSADHANDNVKLFLNNGHAVFTAQSTLSVGNFPIEVVMADIDGDGDADMLTSNNASGTVGIRRNNGTGTFSGAPSLSTGIGIYEVKPGDLDGDGDLDLVIRFDTPNAYKVAINDGAGNFAITATGAFTADSRNLDLADLDGDGDLDMIVPIYSSLKVDILLNEPPFTLTGVSPVRHSITGPRGANVNLTFSAAVDAATAPQVRVFGAQGEGRKTVNGSGAGSVLTLNPSTDFRAGEPVSVTVPAGVLSATGVPAKPHVYQFRAAATGGLGTFGPAMDAAGIDAPYTGTLADVNGDGTLDALCADRIAGTITVSLGTGTGGFTFSSTINVGIDPNDEAAADVDGDGDLDLLVVNSSAGSALTVRFNNGSGTFSGGATVAVANNPSQLTVGDIDGDGDLDVLMGHFGGTNVSVCRNNGSGSFTTIGPVAVGSGPASLALGDVDNDGDLDLATANSFDDNASIRLNDGAGGFSGGSTVSAGDAPESVALGDLDGDGDLDLLVGNFLAGTVSVRFNNGVGVFSGATNLTTGQLTDELTLGDVDGDGDLDFFVTFNGGLTLGRNNGLGTFTTQALDGSLNSTLAMGDLDNDGDLDLIGRNPGGTNLTARLNQDAFMVTAVSPVRHDTDAPRGANVVITFNQSVNNGTSNRIRIWGQQRGGKKAGVYSTSTNTVTFNPTTNFAPGELVSVTVPTTVVSSSGGVARKQVYQYRAAATGGQATFTDVFHATNSGTTVEAVTTADVNGDGKLDIIESHQDNDEVMLHLGNGDGTFAAGTVVGTAQSSFSLTTADVDNDSDLDLLVADRGASVVRVQLNNGSGVFGPATNVSVSGIPNMVVTGDLDGDGDLDLVTVGSAGSSVRFNNGSGGFSGAGGGNLSGPTGVALGDIDGDGDLDVVTAAADYARVSFNNGSGVFGGGYAVSVGAMGANANGVLLGDLDGDSDLDLIVNKQGDNSTAIRLNDGIGQFSGALNLPSGPNGFDAALGDLDGDGDLDIVVANDGGSSSVLLNNGDATFAVGTPAPTTTAFGITLGDVDNDGDLDILNTDEDSSAVQVLLNTNAFTVTARAPERHTATALPSGDVNLTLSEPIKPTTASQLRVFGAQSSGRKSGVFSGIGTSLTLDPLVDLAPGEEVSVTARATILNASSTKNLRAHVYQFRAAATGGSGTFTNATAVALDNTPFCVATGDLNADGIQDLVTTNSGDNQVRIQFGNGDGTYAAVTTFPGGGDPSRVTLADVNADGHLDVLTTNLNANRVGILLNNGSGSFPGLTTINGINFALNVRAADLDGDGDLDLLIGSLFNSVHIRFNNGAGVFSGTDFVLTGTEGNPLVDLAVGDVDNDGDLDLLGANSLDNTVSIHRNNGLGIFDAPTTRSTGPGTNPSNITVGDVDGDGDLDLLVAHSSTGALGVYRNDGFGTFGAPTLLDTGVDAADVALSDVDGDGDLDALVSAPSADEVRLFRNVGAGTFAAAPAISVGAGPQALATADLDNDGDLDFLTADATAHTISVRLNGAAPGPAPTILTFTPDHGVTGTVVTITGTNFTGATSVTFDGVTAPGFVVNPGGTEITVASPPATFNGLISVTTPDGVASTATDFGVDLVITAAESIPAGDFHHITVTATGQATLGGAVEATAPVLVQTGGELADGGNVLSGAGDFTLEAGATLRLRHPQGLGAAGSLQLAGGLTLDPGADYIYQAALAQVTGTNLPAEVRNLTIDNATGVTLTQPTSVRQVLTMAGAGDFSLNGQALTLLSDAAGTALVVNAGAGKVVGAATAQCWLNPAPNPGLGYRHLTSPVATSTFADLTCTGFAPKVNAAYNNSPNPAAVKPFPTIFGFDETRSPGSPVFELGYYSPTSLADAMGLAHGYSVYIKGGLTPDFTGELNQSDVTRAALTRTGNFSSNTEKSGWHLVGNPFPSPMDWDLVPVPAGLNPSISVFRSTGANSGAYLTRANGMGNLADGIIPLGQAFYARVDAALVDLTFTNACRVTTYGTPAHYRPAADPRPAVSLTLRAAGAPVAETDGTTVYFQAGATAGIDRTFDGERPAHNVGLPTLVSLTAASDELAVNGLPEAVLTSGTTVELLLDLPAAGAYELALSKLANLTGADAALLDRLTGTRYELTTQPVVTFATSQAGALRGRFALVFGPAGTAATGRSSALHPVAGLAVYPNPAHGTVQVSVAAGTTSLELLDATGRVLRTIVTAHWEAGTAPLDLSGLVPGVYTMRAGALTQRLVVE